eukprot:9399390-Ditylum_brightwellii.AAC.1
MLSAMVTIVGEKIVIIIIVSKNALLMKYPRLALNDYCSGVFCNHLFLTNESAREGLDSCGSVNILMPLFSMLIVGDNSWCSIVVKE